MCVTNSRARTVRAGRLFEAAGRFLWPRHLKFRPTTLALVAIAATGCSQGGSAPDPELGVSASPRVSSGLGRTPKGGGSYKVGKPYKVAGRWYVPREDETYDETGVASWYGKAFHGRRTANGEVYDMNALSAGHPTLPLPSYAYVTNLDNGRTILVRINDRGPYVNNRIIDLSQRSARELGYSSRGLARVRVRYAGRAPLNGDDRHERRHLAAQTWHRAGTQYAQQSPNPRTAQVRRYEPAPSWSVTRYRGQLASGQSRSQSTGRRSSLGGPPLAYVEAGQFESRASAERMRHELKELGQSEIVPLQADQEETIFSVRIGPLAETAAKDLVRQLAALGLGDSAIVRD